MRLVGLGLILGGLLFVTLATMYFTTPAGALPPFLPGWAHGSSEIRWAQGLLALIVSLACFGFSWGVQPKHRH